MPLFMDVYTLLRDVSTGDVIGAYEPGRSTGDRFGVSYLRHWVSDPPGKVFCLVEAEDPALITVCHGVAPGIVAHEIYPVSEHARGWSGPVPADPDNRPAKGS